MYHGMVALLKRDRRKFVDRRGMEDEFRRRERELCALHKSDIDAVRHAAKRDMDLLLARHEEQLNRIQKESVSKVEKLAQEQTTRDELIGDLREQLKESMSKVEKLVQEQTTRDELIGALRERLKESMSKVEKLELSGSG
ncbi:hypothetical protein GNI_167580 [Gregarina niphandrodes]|uniref:Uncharacterized protein n=1 Tax=Gregarina niphandrodes TaxID=110365 RepID=A0A023AY19_GRENI|nr:hypothetical protein GNI_167580 [Gregarina niphandrodes]EZG43549.1 hypothetical protein GNI_167580 [Gregarina niphandrodes]|eukprot:XP_011133220.1 hypothetical protein GNI_167580 [Gregarina niphandrodes]